MAWGAGTSIIGAEGPKGEKGEEGEKGATGEEGRTVLSGAGPPGEGTGKVGDFYIDTTAHKIYGPKT